MRGDAMAGTSKDTTRATFRLTAAALLALALWGCGEPPEAAPHTTTLDIISCVPAFERECLHFYEQNWAQFRVSALELGHISGYQLLRTAPDRSGGLTLVLLTEYPDSVTYSRAEENFQPLMRELRPDGPALLNDVPRSEFVAGRQALVVHRSPREGNSGVRRTIADMRSPAVLTWRLKERR